MTERQPNLPTNVLHLLSIFTKAHEGVLIAETQKRIERSRRPSLPTPEEVARRVHGDKVIDIATKALENNI